MSNLGSLDSSLERIGAALLGLDSSPKLYRYLRKSSLSYLRTSSKLKGYMSYFGTISDLKTTWPAYIWSATYVMVWIIYRWIALLYTKLKAILKERILGDYRSRTRCIWNQAASSISSILLGTRKSYSRRSSNSSTTLGCQSIEKDAYLKLSTSITWIRIL